MIKRLVCASLLVATCIVVCPASGADYWRELLFYAGNDVHALKRHGDWITLRRKDVKADDGPKSLVLWTRSDLTWSGHTKRYPEWPAAIGFDVSQPVGLDPDKKAKYFLAVADAATSPRLMVTTDEKQASQWTMEVVQSKSGNYSDPREERWGYIRAADILEREAWLTLAPDGANDGRFNQPLALSFKKDALFLYVRLVPQSK